MGSVLSETSGDESPVAKLLSTGNYSQAASNVHSLTSELNVPTNLVPFTVTHFVHKISVKSILKCCQERNLQIQKILSFNIFANLIIIYSCLKIANGALKLVSQLVSRKFNSHQKCSFFSLPKNNNPFV